MYTPTCPALLLSPSLNRAPIVMLKLRHSMTRQQKSQTHHNNSLHQCRCRLEPIVQHTDGEVDVDGEVDTDGVIDGEGDTGGMDDGFRRGPMKPVANNATGRTPTNQRQKNAMNWFVRFWSMAAARSSFVFFSNSLSSPLLPASSATKSGLACLMALRRRRSSTSRAILTF